MSFRIPSSRFRVASLFVAMLTVSAHANPTFSLIHLFPSGLKDGVGPSVYFTDSAGNIYGSTLYGGEYGRGTVFMLSPPTQNGGSWSETILYNFMGAPDGEQPVGSLVMDAQGSLYGTTIFGGAAQQGTIFKLAPDGNGNWNETLLYTFSGTSDGGRPWSGLTFDEGGNLYGTTFYGGDSACDLGCGLVYQLTPSGSSWTESTLHLFHKDSEGYLPESDSPLRVHAGKLYGATSFSAGGNGTVFELSIANRKYSVLHSFLGGTDGTGTRTPLHLDLAGNIFATDDGGDPSCLCGEVYELSPPSGGQTTWTKTTIYAFLNSVDGTDPTGPILDLDGSLYGVTTRGGPSGNGCDNLGGCGTVYGISPQNGTWVKATVYAIGEPYILPAGLIFGPKHSLIGAVQEHGRHHGTAVFKLQGY